MIQLQFLQPNNSANVSHWTSYEWVGMIQILVTKITWKQHSVSCTFIFIKPRHWIYLCCVYTRSWKKSFRLIHRECPLFYCAHCTTFIICVDISTDLGCKLVHSGDWMTHNKPRIFISIDLTIKCNISL